MATTVQLGIRRSRISETEATRRTSETRAAIVQRASSMGAGMAIVGLVVMTRLEIVRRLEIRGRQGVVGPLCLDGLIEEILRSDVIAPHEGREAHIVQDGRLFGRTGTFDGAVVLALQSDGEAKFVSRRREIGLLRQSGPEIRDRLVQAVLTQAREPTI